MSADGFDPAGAADQGLVSIGRHGGHSEAHLREAMSVSARGDSQQVEIQLGHLCNNRCVFCVSGQLTEQGLAPPIPEAPIFAALEEAAARGVRRVTLLGGEPTLQRSFLPTLRKALELGFDDIVIFTNGVRSWKPKFLEEVCGLGRFTWRFSIQGGNPEAHDAVTGRKGSFEKIRRGMRWLHEHGQDITVNLCVNELSFRSLPDYPALMAEHGARQLHVDMVRPNGVGVRDEAWMRSILPRFNEMAPYIEAMVEGFERLHPTCEVHVGNFPYCLIKERAEYVHHGGTSTITVTTDDAGALARVWDKYDYQRSGMEHPPKCGPCAYRAECRGVPGLYRAFYGDDEFLPVLEAERTAIELRRAALLERQRGSDREAADSGDAGDHRRGLLMQLRRIRDGAPYAGWSLHTASVDDSGLHVVLVGPSSGQLELDVPGEGAGAAELRLGQGTSPAEARAAAQALRAALTAPSRSTTSRE